MKQMKWWQSAILSFIIFFVSFFISAFTLITLRAYIYSGFIQIVDFFILLLFLIPAIIASFVNYKLTKKKKVLSFIVLWIAILFIYASIFGLTPFRGIDFIFLILRHSL